MTINKEFYKLEPKNYYKEKHNKTQIIIGTSLRASHNHIIHLNNVERGRSKKWNTYTISREGEIYQHFEPEYYSDFIGVKDVDKKSISIVFENMGPLFKSVDDESFVNWINEKCLKENVFEKKWFGENYWEIVTHKQYNALGNLCNDLCDKFDIPSNLIDFHYYNADAPKYKGILFRSNIIENSSDILPTFDILKLQNLIK